MISIRQITNGTVQALLFAGVTSISTLAPAYSNSAEIDAQFTKMDANSDGLISTAEHAAAARQMFEMMDANRDGRVTVAEMDAAHARVTGSKPAKDDLTAAEKIKAIDTDGDGILTASEHAAGSRAMFEQMDTNKDGFLSRIEFAIGHINMLKKI